MYDVAVLGAGPGGYVAALRAALRGAKVCIIEEKYLGGTCLNVGCIPTKAMLHGSEIYHNMNNAKEFGITSGKSAFDDSVFMKRVAKVVGGLTGGVGFLLKKRGVDVVDGRGKLTAKDTIEVTTKDGTKQIKAKSIIIATGSKPAKPGIFAMGF
jgi:dihydrolipoamide dehydrogenase